MSRTIKKKVIDDRLEFSDSFDESMLDRIESELDEDGKVIGSPEAKPRRRRESPDGQETFEDDSDESMNFPEPPEDRPEPPEDKSAPPIARPSPLDEKQEAVPVENTVIHRKIATKKRLILAVALILFVVLPGIVWFQMQRSHRELPAVVQMLRRPVPIPHYQQETSFFILAPAGGKKDVIELAMELEFFSASAFENFNANRVLFQDIVYRFLQSRNPPENSYKHWANIIQAELPVYLKANVPSSRVESITITQFTRL
jgi:hypothetical protein